MPLIRKTTGVEKTKRETGSIDKVRINDNRVQVLTSEGKIYVFDKRDVCTVTNISLNVNDRPVNASFENSGYGASTNAIRFQRYPIVEFVNLAPETVKNYMKSILMESVLDLSDVKVIHSYKWVDNEPHLYMPDDWDDGRIYAKLSDEDADKAAPERVVERTIIVTDDLSDEEYDLDYEDDGYEDDWYYEDEDE